ncbi:hypothetical protein D3C87_611430 [compost metagenome]
MQGIESKRHSDMLRVIEKFEALLSLHGHHLAHGHKEAIMKMSRELKGSHEYYLILLKEVEHCIITYTDMHNSLRKLIYPSVRKMSTLSKKS